MKIGIDCRTILNPESGEKAGIGQYTYQLVLNLTKQNKDDEIFLFFSREASRAASKLQIQNEKCKIVFFPEWKVRIPFIFSHLYIGKWLNKFNLDILHAPAHTYPLGYNGRVVVTVHDLAIYKYPQYFPKQPFSTKFLVPKSLHQASHIISVSQSTKDDIIDIFGIDENKISVIYLGFEPEQFSPIAKQRENETQNLREKFGIEKPYLLSVGTLQPRKNHVGLIRAFKKSDLRSKYQLVIAGNKGWMYEPIFQEAEKLGSDVVFTDYVKADELPELYGNASAFAFPSFYEGFGLPLLEAMASGVPVISGNTSSLPEVGGEVPVYVDPNNIEEISQALGKVLTNEQERQRQLRLSPRQVEKFSWEKMAKETLDVYERLG